MGLRKSQSFAFIIEFGGNHYVLQRIIARGVFASGRTRGPSERARGVIRDGQMGFLHSGLLNAAVVQKSGCIRI